MATLTLEQRIQEAKAAQGESGVRNQELQNRPEASGTQMVIHRFHFDEEFELASSLLGCRYRWASPLLRLSVASLYFRTRNTGRAGTHRPSEAFHET
jgi:hypothetical protein